MDNSQNQQIQKVKQLTAKLYQELDALNDEAMRRELGGDYVDTAVLFVESFDRKAKTV